MRVCHKRELRHAGPASRLLALALDSHLPSDSAHAQAAEDVLSHTTALTPEQLHRELTLLLNSRYLQHWAHNPLSGDLLWTIVNGHAAGGALTPVVGP
ncbi:hypothetical protein [Streptomyces sp. NPDC050422]|uniref:hypothetical protein n=1 Tax=Streptomyces sp. NPDC050422 TaxID=3365614 RepID=UPI00378E845A